MSIYPSAAYNAGRRAYGQVTLNDCPYVKGTPAYDDWREGFIHEFDKAMERLMSNESESPASDEIINIYQ